MGNDQTKTLSPEDLEDLQNSTSFDKSAIKEWYNTFRKECPEEKMNKSDFQKMYTRIFPKGDATEFANHVFRVYDIDANGTIDFQEFLCSISMSTKGGIDDQLRWAFNLYDMDGNGSICREEAVKILESIYRARESKTSGAKRPVRERAQETVNLIFEKLDDNNDNKLTDMEFILGAKMSPEVLALLES